MDEELKSLVEQVESCFPERTTNSKVINVATVLLTKAAVQIAERMPISKAAVELELMLTNVVGNVTTNVKIALMRKQLRDIAPEDPLNAQDLNVIKQMFECHESNAN